jgi:hypothetical protein
MWQKGWRTRAGRTHGPCQSADAAIAALDARAKRNGKEPQNIKLHFTEKADRDYAGLPVIIRKAHGKQLRFLLANRAHPLCMRKKQ